MKLHAPYRPFDMAQGHQNPISGPSDLLQLWRQRFADDQRVIANRAKPLGNAGKQFVAVMNDLGAAAMHRFSRGNNTASKMVRNPLVPQAYAEQRNFGLGNHS